SEMESSRDESQTEFIYCSGAATEVLKVGSCRLLSGQNMLFLIIPGNPGVVGFYKTFMQTLHSILGYPVWAVSHAGHCAPPDSMDMVLKAVMLFPTIERMSQTPQGKVMTPWLCQLRYLAYLPLFLLSLLPDSLTALLIRLIFSSIPSLDPCVVRPSVELLSGDCAGGLTSVPQLSHGHIMVM
ncbi:hypothetical protein XENOCAPTIV_020534, partial [Xenoophorus captivus]